MKEPHPPPREQGTAQWGEIRVGVLRAGDSASQIRDAQDRCRAARVLAAGTRDMPWHRLCRCGVGLFNPPAGMSVSTNGIITWTPAQTQSPSTNVVMTVATNNDLFDLVNPVLTSTNTFAAIVREVNGFR